MTPHLIKEKKIRLKSLPPGFLIVPIVE